MFSGNENYDKDAIIPFVIWKIEKEDEIRCFLNNRQIKDDTLLEEYLQTNNLENFYNELYKSDKLELLIQNNNGCTVLSKINDFILEFNYPNCDNLNILYSVSHKIRGPLTNILGMLTILDSLDIPKDQHKYLNIIKKSSYDIVSVVNDVIDIVNLKKNNVKLNPQNVLLENLVINSSKIVSNAANEKKLTLTHKLGNNLPNIVAIDEQYVRQIIVNLLNNAIKFTKVGLVSIEILPFDKISDIEECPFTHIKPQDDECNLLFKIKDTGCGLDDDHKIVVDSLLGTRPHKKIKSYINHGFGLTICNSICKLMGGNIWYKTQVDMGTIFYFNIICKAIKLDI